MVLGDRCEMFFRRKAKLVPAQKDLIKSPLLYIIICITFFIFMSQNSVVYDGVQYQEQYRKGIIKDILPLHLLCAVHLLHTHRKIQV